MSEERQAYIEKARETESWLIDRLLYAVQFYVYADADRKDVSEMLESLTEGDSWDEQVAALVRMPKWISRNKAQEIVDQHFRTPPPPPQHREPIEADRPYPQLLDNDESKALLARAEQLWSDLQANNLGGFSGINRPFYILHEFRRVIEQFGNRDVGLTWSKDQLDAHRLAFSTPAASDAEAMREVEASISAAAASLLDGRPSGAYRAGVTDLYRLAIRALPLPKAGEGEA